MIIALNFLAGVTAMFFMSLVIIGQYRHSLKVFRTICAAMREAVSNLLRRNGHGKQDLHRLRFELLTAGDWMRFAVVLFHIKGLVRIIVYDVAWIMVGRGREPWVAYWNISFCAMASMGALAALWAMYLNIPKDRRKDYTWLTSPWFPETAPFHWRNRK